VDRIRQHIISLDMDCFLESVVKIQTAKYEQYIDRCNAWDLKIAGRLTTIEEQMMSSYSYSLNVSRERWNAVIRKYIRREDGRNLKKFKRWDRKFKVNKSPPASSLRHDYKVASTDIESIIRAMVARSIPPIQLRH
jgi:hypothetical protein